jgi:hypothetical protein
MFIYVVDKELKKELISSGFKMLKEDDKGAFFAFNKKSKFNFDDVDKTKFLFTDRLTF